jgi:hypothetical protein
MGDAPVFVLGQRVRLKPNADEGWEEEFGTVLDDVFEGDGTAMVEVDEEFAQNEGDDCLREVSFPEENMEAADSK